MEISKFIKDSDHNPYNFHIYPEGIRNRYIVIVRNAIRCGTISGRRYKMIKSMIHEYSYNQEGSPIYNIHPFLFRTIKNNGLSNIYANIFPKRIAIEDNKNYRYYSDHGNMWAIPCMKYRKYYIGMLMRNSIENYTIDKSPEYHILEWIGWRAPKTATSVMLIMDNIMKRSGIEVILSRGHKTSIGCSYFENKMFYFVHLQFYIRILVRRRRKSIVIRLGSTFFDLLIGCFSPFVSKNCSRLAMYYV